jgi:hypothetical protein
MFKELCRKAKALINLPFFKDYCAHYPDCTLTKLGEVTLVLLFAQHEPETIISWVAAEFPDDPFPVDRLSPYPIGSIQ